MFLHRVDPTTGIFIEDVIIEGSADDRLSDPAYIATPCPPGFYWPRWDGEKWAEGGTAPEASTPEPTEIDQMREIVTQTSADFMAFMEYYFTANPE